MLREMLILTTSVAMMGIGPAQTDYEYYYENINHYEMHEKYEAQEVTSTYIVRYDVNWFDEIQHTFGRGTDAVVRDIGTGRTFNIRRTFGTNHADVEPLTKEDAAAMNAIWGGHSWARRPVVIYVGNYIFAGSLTNFPHAGVDGQPPLATVDNRSGGFGRGLNFDAVAGNGVNGHMCLHFAGSLIHGSNQKNPAHQEAVARAIEYIQANY